MKSIVAVIDYGMGNLHSIAKALQHVARTHQIMVTGDSGVIMSAERVVFPGVGAIGDCMMHLRERGLDRVIRGIAETKPLLGICLGMQALLDTSEESGGTHCLGIVPGVVKRFEHNLKDSQGEILKIPHMGWNNVRPSKNHPLWEGIPEDTRFYFVHSFYASPATPTLIAGLTDYPNPFVSAIASKTMFAVQFHPEKSQTHGLKLLQNFLNWNPT